MTTTLTRGCYHPPTLINRFWLAPFIHLQSQTRAADITLHIEAREPTLTCVALAEDSHGLSAHCVHAEGILLWDLQRSGVLLPITSQGSQLLVQAETDLWRNTQSTHCYQNSLLAVALSNQAKWDLVKFY